MDDKKTQMLARERHREILNRVAEVGGVRVASLADELKVTPETIRRDLERLGSEGKLIRIHGGAMPIGNDRRELPLDVRGTVNLAEKRLIARHALRYIAHGDVIALERDDVVVVIVGLGGHAATHDTTIRRASA